MLKGDPLICEDCGIQFGVYEFGGPPKRCPSCNKAAIAERGRKAGRKYSTTPKGRAARRKRYERRRALQSEEERKLEAFKWHLKREYGLTLEEYDEFVKGHGNRCAICARGPEHQQRRLHVDHDHESGKIRGLLCSSCNTGLGQFQDDPELLEEARKYLAAYKALDAYAERKSDPRQE